MFNSSFFGTVFMIIVFGVFVGGGGGVVVLFSLQKSFVSNVMYNRIPLSSFRHFLVDKHFVVNLLNSRLYKCYCVLAC